VLLDLGEYDSLDVQLESRNTRNTRRRWCVNVFEKFPLFVFTGKHYYS